MREPFVSVPLEDSRRSTPAVLAFVDAVFADPEAAAGLSPGRAHEPLHHRALRDDAFGAIDVWPLKESDETDEVDPWWSPVDARPGKTGNKKLAERIAKTIKQMIADRVAVFDKVAKTNRAVTAGDFLILVRRRGNLFHEIIRALKAADVASGGADRLALSEHIAFKDLLALGRFARFPGDDLTLAALLRSPFCDVGEASLFDLAYGRGGASLWATLNRRVSECGDWRAARDFLGWARAEADARPPFDFYARVLTRLDGRGRSMRARLLTRLGREAEDAIEAFLGEALSLERRRVHDLERFVDEMAKTDIEVKREAEEAQGEVQGDDGPWRQGAGGADRHPARHHHARYRAGRAAAGRSGRRVPLGAAQAGGLPGVRGRSRGARDGCRIMRACACSTSRSRAPATG